MAPLRHPDVPFSLPLRTPRLPYSSLLVSPCMPSSSDHTFPMALVPFFFLLLLLPFPSVSSRSVPKNSQTGVVGVVYSMSTPGLPSPKQVADSLVAAGVTRVLLVDTYPEGIAAFNHTSFCITIGIKNTYLPVLAANLTEAFRWIGDNIIGTYVTVETISVGHDVLTDYLGLAHYLLPALRNLHEAFTEIGMEITLSTTSGYELITPGFPPSAAHFNTSVVETHVEPLMEFLAETASPFFIQLFPFKLYNTDAVPRAGTGLATFDARDGNFLTDPKTGLIYRDMFDAMVDATAAALDKLGYADIQLVVAGTGWPSAGADEEPEASPVVAAEYNERLMSKLNMGLGTPARPKVTPVTYIFSLLDGPKLAGVDSAWNWGIWTKDMKQKYLLDFTSSDSGSGSPRRPGRTLLSAATGWAASIAFFLFA